MVTQTRTALGLSPKEKKAVKEFLAAVKLEHGGKIQRAALFGSKVRGEAEEYSDIDILLIVTDDNWRFRRDISRISSGIALKFDVLLDVRVIGAARWQYMADIQSGLYQNISRDAVAVTGRKRISHDKLTTR